MKPNVKNSKLLDSKICHVNVEKLTILDKGDGGTWNPPVPVLPNSAPASPVKRPCDPNVDSAFDNLSPSKKQRCA
ncbi:hypothetical protein B0H13DRAFT_2363178 [Mycena leptocephala]|nr:hypothetical protein B0H13DRAFT_2363178 [Mycena leptocephala]